MAAFIVVVAAARGAVAVAADLCDRDRRGSSSFVRSSGAGSISSSGRGEARAAAAGLGRSCGHGVGALGGGEEGIARGRCERGEAVASSSAAAAGEEGRRRGGDAEAPGEGVGLRLKEGRNKKRVGVEDEKG